MTFQIAARMPTNGDVVVAGPGPAGPAGATGPATQASAFISGFLPATGSWNASAIAMHYTNTGNETVVTVQLDGVIMEETNIIIKGTVGLPVTVVDKKVTGFGSIWNGPSLANSSTWNPPGVGSVIVNSSNEVLLFGTIDTTPDSLVRAVFTIHIR